MSGPASSSATSIALRCHLAEGCDLATLQRLHSTGPEGLVEELGLGPEDDDGHMLDAAAGSPTPDWRGKVEWLEAAGYSSDSEACMAAAERPDALARLTWLVARGFALSLRLRTCMNWLTSRADLEVLERLIQESDDGWGLQILASTIASTASWHGHLEVLQALRERGLFQRCHDVSVGARRGQLHVVAWMVDTWGGEEVLTPWLFAEAARSGSVELMGWLRERGCPWDAAGAYGGAAEAGSQEALEWLAVGGCPVQVGRLREHLLWDVVLGRGILLMS